jgi:hypothetical protein
MGNTNDTTGRRRAVTASGHYVLQGVGVMETLTLIKQLTSALRELIAPSYRPELHYMRGPGPAYARRMVAVEARRPGRR